jgi:xanthine dehydrogenase accessory factor
MHDEKPQATEIRPPATRPEGTAGKTRNRFAVNDDVLNALLQARADRVPCAMVTVAATSGSVPRHAGAKMLVFGDGRITGTIGGGKFEALVIDESRAALRTKLAVLKTFPLHEGSTESFGAICGGEATVLIEPQGTVAAIFLVGGGHCSKAIADLAGRCGMFVTVIDDRAGLLDGFPARRLITDQPPAAFIAGRTWQADEAIVIASRHHEIDREALAAAVAQSDAGYIGMIGSERKVRRVFDELEARGIPRERLDRFFAPMGIDIAADSPEEIAVSVVAEVLSVLRNATGRHLRETRRPGTHDERAT